MMRIIAVLACVFALGLAGVIWLSDQETLAFDPEVGDVRYFVVDQTSDVSLLGRANRKGISSHTNSILRSEVVHAGDDYTELRSGVVRASERVGRRTLVDTESVGRQSDEKTRLADFLKAGVVERISHGGVPMNVSYQGPSDGLESVEARPEFLQVVLLRSLRLFAWYPAQFPSDELAAGMTWQTAEREMDGLTLHPLQFKVSHLDDQTVTLTFGPLDPEREVQANAYHISGYLELERESGWPRQAAAKVLGGANYRGTMFEVNSRLSLRQTDIPPGPEPDRLLSQAEWSVRALPVDTSSSEFADHFQPSLGPISLDQGLAKLRGTLAWFGMQPVDYGYERSVGVESQVNSSDLQRVQFSPVIGVRLLGSDGEPVRNNVVPNPDFTLFKPDAGQGRPRSDRLPFLREGLTDEQLESVDTIELDMRVTRPDKMHTALLTPSQKEIEFDSAGLTLAIEDWSPERVRIRVETEEGIPVGELPPVMGYPVDQSGDAVPQFTIRMAHSTIESALAAIDTASANTRGERREMAKVFLDYIDALPPHEKKGVFIFEYTGTQSHPVDRLQFHYYSTRTEEITMTAPSALTTLSGGKVVSERTLYRGNVPRFDLKSERDEAASYRMDRSALPMVSAGGDSQLEQVENGTLKVSAEFLKTLQEVQSAFSLKQLPLVAFNEEGGALFPLGNGWPGPELERLQDGSGLIRYWGDIDSVEYPVSVLEGAR
ncbi:hypothetical protein [Marinobacter nauticus]|nr:hypothetical protein [Marinobacter nauticus]